MLELGYATGVNIIPIAVHYPIAKTIGIDLSKTEVEWNLLAKHYNDFARCLC